MASMRFIVAVALVLIAYTVGIFHTVSAEQAAASSTWSGVYTEAQAKVGEGHYVNVCAECHGQDLAGDGFAPSLKGPEFMSNWNGLTVGELYERIRISMPPSDPEALGGAEKADVVAFILKQAGFPAGETKLAATTEALKAIKFEATKPGR